MTASTHISPGLFSKSRFIDLTRIMGSQLPTLGIHPDFTVSEYRTIEEHGSSVQGVSLGSHTGTHLDAPSHFVPGGPSVESLDLHKTMGECVVLDFTDKGANDVITAAEIKRYEATIRATGRILIRTDWERSHVGADYLKDFPVLTINAAKLLVEYGVLLVGMDTPSPGPMGPDGATIHAIMLEADVVIVESLINLHQIPNTAFTIMAMPLPLDGCSGSPCRALALVEDSHE